MVRKKVLTVIVAVSFITQFLHYSITPVSATSHGVPIEEIFPFAKNFPTFGALINVLLPNALLIAGLILLIIIIIAGFGIMQSAGSGDAEGAAKGKKALTYAVAGFVIIFTAFWIVKLIEFITGVKIFDPVLAP